MKEPTQKALAEAAAWRVHLSEADQETTPEFEAWLQADSAHGQAWASVERSWNIFSGYSNAPEVLALRQTALADAHEAARRRSVASAGTTGRPTRLRKGSLLTLAAAACLMVAASAWYFARPEVYSTHLGERRVIALADGSKVQLDSGSELSIAYTSHERNLTLFRGQARFDVAHDNDRPFVVAVGGQKVVATGTAFNIDVLGPRILVTLIEGEVLVLPRNDLSLAQSIAAFAQSKSNGNAVAKPQGISSGAVELAAGQEMITSRDGSSKVNDIDVSHVTAWQKGQLLFDDEPLKSVIERVNRYSAKPVVLADDSIRQLRISGVFDTNDIPGFITTITHYLPIQASNRANSIELTRR